MAKKPFPLIETFGFHHDARTAEALRHFEKKLCPFAENPCEKFRQYGFGYCSVTYSAADDAGQQFTYAVCDHRVDGKPLSLAIKDHFGERKVEIVPEVVLRDPRTSFDYVAVERKNGAIVDAIAIETQAIDLRGGGVGPAFQAWLNKDLENWRAYFTAEAANKSRSDTVAYGVNMANIYKRLGLQVATKGSLLKAMGIKLYVVMQDRPFQYLRRRVPFEETKDWDITFMTFDYTGNVADNGQMEFKPAATVRTSLENYTTALSSDRRAADAAKEDFFRIVSPKLARG